jgi:AAA domain
MTDYPSDFDSWPQSDRDDWLAAEEDLRRERQRQKDAKASSAPLLIWYGDEPPPPPAYLVRNMLPETGVGILGGQTTLGKTFIGADLAGAVMTKGVFAGEPVLRRGGVLWFAAEGEKDIEARIRAAVESKFKGSGPQPFARQAEGVPLLTAPDALQKLTAHAEEARGHMQAAFGLPLALIVVDTVSAAAGFDDENSASETQKVMTVLSALSRATGALVLPIDHYGKIDETGIRGSSAKSAAADVILACLGIRDKEGNVSNQRLAVAKIRNGAAGRVIPFELKPVDGTCVVDWRLDGAAAAAESEKPKERWPKTLAIFKRALQNALTDFGSKMHPFADNLEVLAVDREKVRNEFMRSYPGDNRKTKGEAWRRYEKDAVSRDLIGSRELGGDQSKTVFWVVHEEP